MLWTYYHIQHSYRPDIFCANQGLLDPSEGTTKICPFFPCLNFESTLTQTKPLTTDPIMNQTTASKSETIQSNADQYWRSPRHCLGTSRQKKEPSLFFRYILKLLRLEFHLWAFTCEPYSLFHLWALHSAKGYSVNFSQTENNCSTMQEWMQWWTAYLQSCNFLLWLVGFSYCPIPAPWTVNIWSLNQGQPLLSCTALALQNRENLVGLWQASL